MTLPTVGFTPAAFNGPIFTDLTKAFPAIASVIGAATASVSGDQLLVNWAGSNFSAGDQVVISFGPGAVPEPATWAMMIAGAGLVGGAMRRQRATVTKLSYAA